VNRLLCVRVSQSLESAFSRYQALVSSSASAAFDPDAPYQIIALLIHLAQTRTLFGATVPVSTRTATAPAPELQSPTLRPSAPLSLLSPMKTQLNGASAAATRSADEYGLVLSALPPFRRCALPCDALHVM
jgi:hypothetical protein